MAEKTIRTEPTRVFWYTRGNGGPNRHTEVNDQEYVTFTGTAGVVRQEVGPTGVSYWTFNGTIIKGVPLKPGGLGITDVDALRRMADGRP